MTAFEVNRIINPGGTIGPSEIVVDNGIITEIRPLDAGSEKQKTAAGNETSAGSVAIPGFIDMHTHGAAGHDIMDGNRPAMEAIARHHLQQGTTAFLGSTLTAPIDQLEGLLDTAREFEAENEVAADAGTQASLLGIHLEGPWISPERAGAQNTAYMTAPDAPAIDLVRRHSDLVRMVTFSYHYPSAGEFLDALTEMGIIAAVGHDATLDTDIVKAFARGLRHVTHIYSMTSSFGRAGGFKHLGTLEMALMTPGVSVEVIADDRHITRHFWDFIRHNKSVDDIVIVSDSMRWAGMPSDPDAVIRVGEMEVIVDDGVAWLADRSAFAGSIATMHDMFRRLVSEWEVPIQDAVRMTAWNPAAKLGVERTFGSVEPGKAADFLILDKALEIESIVKSGVKVKR